MTNSMEVLLKIKNETTIWPSHSILMHISFLKSTNSKRYIQPNVHSSTIYNSQDAEAIKCSSRHEWIKTMVYTHTQWNISHKKGWKLAFCNNKDGPGWYYASEISETEKNKYFVLSLTCGI